MPQVWEWVQVRVNPGDIKGLHRERQWGEGLQEPRALTEGEGFAPAFALQRVKELHTGCDLQLPGDHEVGHNNSSNLQMESRCSERWGAISSWTLLRWHLNPGLSDPRVFTLNLQESGESSLGHRLSQSNSRTSRERDSEPANA